MFALTPEGGKHTCRVCYRVYQIRNGTWLLVGFAPSYICPRCGARSFNPHDIAEHYCGRCHQFEDLQT